MSLRHGERCRDYRRRILDISQQVTALHVAPAFSCIEIVDAIYNELMRRERERRARATCFLMSKGHGCMIQYVILEELGILSRPTSTPIASRTAGSARTPITGRRASRHRPARSAMGSAWPPAWPMPRG